MDVELVKGNGHKPGGSYSDEEVERGLIEVAFCAGNTRRAHRQLKARGHDIPRSTLEQWANRHYAERYERIRSEVMPRVHAKLAIESEDLARKYAAAEEATLERYEKELPNLRASEAASAVRNLATSRGISTDKARLLRDKPTQVTEHRPSPEAIWRQFKEWGVVDADAEEIPPPELPPAA